MAWQNNRPTHVPPAVRAAALRRDGNRCTVIQRNGERCPETKSLEAAHKRRWRKGEKTTVDMVETQCHWHHTQQTAKESAEARRAAPRPPSPRHPREVHPGLR